MIFEYGQIFQYNHYLLMIFYLLKWRYSFALYFIYENFIEIEKFFPMPYR